MKRNTFFAYFIVLVLVGTLILSSAALAFESDHECTGEDCLVCLVVSRAQNVLSEGFGILFATVFSLAFLAFCISAVCAFSAENPHATLVLLKDKLSD